MEILSNFKIQLTAGNKKHEEARKKNSRLSYDTNCDETEEEMVTYTVNRNIIDVNKFINRDITTDMTIGIDSTLNYMPEVKERLDKTKTNKEVKNAETLHIQDINYSKSNQASMEKDATNL